MTIAHLTHAVCTVVDALLRPRRFPSRSSGWLYPALTFASSLVIAPIAGLGPVAGAESEPLPSSVLILNQTRAGLPWFAALCARKHCANSFTGLRRFKLHKGEGRAVRECGSAATSPPWPMLWAHRRACQVLSTMQRTTCLRLSWFVSLHDTCWLPEPGRQPGAGCRLGLGSQN